MGQSWVFQANPKRFDIDAFLNERPKGVSWITPQSSDQMSVGDIVYIWRSKAGGPDYRSGVIAACIIEEPPIERSDDPNTAHYWMTDEDRDVVRKRVELSIRSIYQRVSPIRSEALADDALSKCEFVKGRQQTNFLLTSETAQKLAAYAERVPKR